MADDVRVAVASAGILGRRHARVFQELEGSTFVAFADPSPEKATAAAAPYAGIALRPMTHSAPVRRSPAVRRATGIGVGFFDPTSDEDARAITNGWSVGAYIQDEWQATRNLQLTFGLRYDAEINTLNNDFSVPWAEDPELQEIDLLDKFLNPVRVLMSSDLHAEACRACEREGGAGRRPLSHATCNAGGHASTIR